MSLHSFNVFYEQRGTSSADEFYTSITRNVPDFTLNSAHGDEAVLMSTTGSTHLQYWVDTVNFNAAQQGYSFGRYPEFNRPLVTMDHNTFGSQMDDTYPPECITEFRKGTGASNALPRVGPLIIHRIMYHPSSNGDKFIEDTIELFKPDPVQAPPHPDAGYVPQILVEKVGYLPTSPWPVAAAGNGAALLRLDSGKYANEASNWKVDLLLPPELSVSLVSASSVQLSFTAAPGRGYVVAAAVDLAAKTRWTTLAVLDPTMSGAPVKIPVNLIAAHQFLRVR